MVHSQQYGINDTKAAVCPKCGCKRLLFGQGKLTCTDCGHVMGRVANKYHAKKQTYNGHNYDSQLEARYAADFDVLVQAGELKAVRRQVTLPLSAYGQHICNYKIDFILEHNDGHLEYAEVKGYATDLWKFKWKLLEAQLAETDPGATLTVYK